jgi:hypothetical protein
VDDRSLIVAGPAVDPDPQAQVGQAIAPARRRMALAVLAGPCTRPELSPVARPAPAAALLLVPPGRALVPAPALARPALASVVQVA